MRFLFAICVVAAAICACNSARILGVFHMPAYSHFQLGDKIFKALAARGHEVTVITPYAAKTPTKNFKEVVLTGFADEMVCVVAAAICACNSARILGVFHMPAYSHFQLGDKIFKALAARGHEVTVITPYAAKTPTKNFKEVVLTGFADEMEKIKEEFFGKRETIITKFVGMAIMGPLFSEKILNHTNVQKLLKSDEQFDLVIIENFMNEAFKGFCSHFKAPCIMQSTMGSSRWTNPQMGNPGPPSYVPDLLFNLPSQMNFWQRLCNSMVYVLSELLNHLYSMPSQEALLHKYFPDAPPLCDLQYNSSLMLLNSHVSTNPAVPTVPNMIEIGGFHINPPKKLPKDLQDYLDGAKNGVIFFSLGSNMKSTFMPAETRNAILTAFSKLKENVLWKWEDDTLPGQPPNVKLGKWLPQQDILAHPNVKLFITHGGLLSTIETIYHGKPIIGIPVGADQEMNVANAELAGYGLNVPYFSLTEEDLSRALNEVLTNPKYAENAQTRSRIMHDQPMKPLDKAIFWIEYVLRHRGAPHLRTAALNLTWYQYLLLDVVAFIVVVTFGSLYISYKIIKAVCCRKKGDKKVTASKKQN